MNTINLLTYIFILTFIRKCSILKVVRFKRPIARVVYLTQSLKSICNKLVWSLEMMDTVIRVLNIELRYSVLICEKIIVK